MMRLPWRGKTVPHAVLDILRGCNCRCAHCYNAGRAAVCKDIGSLRGELAVIRSRRNVTTITLSGGEPLLHPDIVRIVRWLARGERLKVSILTNGVAFTPEAAARLSEAGCSLVSFHIQSGQIRPDMPQDADADALRREKGRLARENGIFPALILTLGAADADGFRETARFIRAAPEYEYALITVAKDFSAIDPEVRQPDVDTSALLSALDSEGYSPSAFVGGRYDRAVPRWIILQSARATDAGGRERAWTRVRPGLLERAFLWTLAAVFRRSVHWVRSTSAGLKIRLLLNGVLGGHPSTSLFALKAILRGWRISEKHIVVQIPPRSLGGGRVEVCDDCPDATVRNGRLHPLCLSDNPKEVFL